MKDKIITELRQTGREGMENVVNFLVDSDFFSAPASSKFHGAEIGGLVRHSLNVMKTMKSLNREMEKNYYDSDTITIVGLLHDVCKVNTYKPNLLKSGELSTSKPYKKEDKFPIGHGEKSVIILLGLGLELTNDEMLAIRYHMNMFDDGGYRFNKNWNKLSILCFLADYFTSTFLDVRGSPR